MHRRDHRLRDARRRADRVLEGADVGARFERAAGGVWVLWEREQFGHCGGWGCGARGGGGGAIVIGWCSFLGRVEEGVSGIRRGAWREGVRGCERTVYAC